MKFDLLLFCCMPGRYCLKFSFMRNNVLLFCFLLQTKVALLFLFVESETIYGCFVLCCMWNKMYLIVEYCKKSNFWQKTKRENGKSVNIGKKTIQVSNFHNRAETNINSKEPLFVFWRKNSAISSGTILNRTKYGLIFQKIEKGFFFWKDFERNEKCCRFVFRKRKGFLFCAQPNGKNRRILFTEKLSGRKTAFIQKASNRLTREQNFLIIDWHCYIIITIVTKK